MPQTINRKGKEMAIKDIRNEWSKKELSILRSRFKKWDKNRRAGLKVCPISELDKSIAAEIWAKLKIKRSLDGIRAARSKYNLVTFHKQNGAKRKDKGRKRKGVARVTVHRAVTKPGKSPLEAIFVTPEQEAAFNYFCYSVGKTKTEAIRDLVDYALKEFYRAGNGAPKQVPLKFPR